MRIGELSRRSGVPVRTLRFYDAIGLVPAPGRTEGGYREYPDQALDRVRFVRAALDIGLRLKDAAAILAVRDGGQLPCVHVRELVRAQLHAVEGQLARLSALRRELIALQRMLEEAMAGPGDAAGSICPCIEAISIRKGVSR